MMRMTKRKRGILSILLCFCLLLTCVPVTAFAEDTCEHEYQWSMGYNQNEENHELVCACGDRVYLPHENNDGDRVCDVCGYCMIHEYQWEDGSLTDDYAHEVYCDCGDTEYLPHENNDGDRFCDVCEYCMTHEYQWKDGSFTDDYAHEVYCDCGDTEYLPHENNDGDRVCDVCGYCMEHEYFWAEGGNADEYIHYLTCDCGEALPEPHIDENEDEYCDLCSHSISCMHQDADNDGFCDFCGICKAHSFEQQNWYIDEDAHYPKCDNCSYYVDTEGEPHKDSNNDGICEVCGNTNSTEPAICEYNGTQYTNINKAMDDWANGGGTLTLLADATYTSDEVIFFADAANYELNLNSHTLTLEGNAYLYVQENLVVKNGSIVSYAPGGAIQMNADGSLENVSVEAVNAAHALYINNSDANVSVSGCSFKTSTYTPIYISKGQLTLNSDITLTYPENSWGMELGYEGSLVVNCDLQNTYTIRGEQGSKITAAAGHTLDRDNFNFLIPDGSSVLTNDAGTEITIGICEHKGGTATCTEQAVCTVCATPYGELEPHMITDDKCSVCDDELIVEIDGSTSSRTYNGSEKTQTVFAIFGGTRLSEGTDYTVSYTNNIDVGTATITVTGKEGTVYANINKTATFEIIPAEISIDSVAIKEKTYDGKTEAIVESMDYSGVVSGDEVFITASAEFVDADAGEGKEVKIKDIALTGDDAKNYKIAAEFTSTGNIIPKDITVTPDAGQTKKCGEEDPVFTYEVEGIILDDTLEGKLGREAGEDVGEYAYTIGTLSNSNYDIQLADNVKFVIIKGEQSAPAVNKEDETISAKKDGKITDVDSTMEYRKDGESTYTAVTGTEVTNLSTGKYYVRYKETVNYYASPESEVFIGAGDKLTVTVPQNQVGYKLTTTTPEMDWYGTMIVQFELLDGYSMTDDFEIYNGIEPMWQHFNHDTGVLHLNFIANNFNFTVQGVEDTSAPTAEIQIKNNRWTSLLHSITFGLFFNDTQDVNITAGDVGSGIKDVYYYIANRELTSEELQTVEWKFYTKSFSIDPDGEYVIYAKVVDNGENAVIVSSDGIVLDATAPSAYDIENGGVYYGDKVFKVTDEYLNTLKVDGVDVTTELNSDNEYTILADNAEHAIFMTDKAGNVSEFKITVYKNYTVTYKADEVVIGTQTVGHGKNAEVPEIPEKDGHVGKWDRDNENITADTEIKAVYTEIANVVPDDFRTEDKTGLEDTKKQLEEMLKDNSYTMDNRKDIQSAIEEINDALEVIGNVENVENLIDKIPDKVTKDDEDTIKAADDAYNALTDNEKAHVNQNAKKVLNEAKTALTELNKSVDKDTSQTENSQTNSPQTGDNSNLWLWFVLLFTSSSALIVTVVYGSRKRYREK